MNEKEKQEFYIAMCNCCLLAEVMKDCRLCRFNIGLAAQAKATPADSTPLPIPIQMPIFAMAE